MQKDITVYSNGTVSETLAEVHPGVKVVWTAENRAVQFTVRFKKKQPFQEQKWKNDREETGTMVDGTIRSHGHGHHVYPYDVIVGNTGVGPEAGPELIVDGGEGVIEPKKPKKPKKAKKAKKAKKGKKTKKSAKKP